MHRAERLPDCYRKDEESNNYKLLELNALAAEELKEDINLVLAALDLNAASGETLNLYGEMLEQPRGLLNDDQYRYLLLAKIGRNCAQGDYDSIIDTLLLMLNCQDGSVTRADIAMEDSESPWVVHLSRFPVWALVDVGFSSRQVVQMINLLLPVCVTLYADNFEGTFEFAELDQEYSKLSGFANLEQTVGGYFGMLLGEDDERPVLPL